MTLVTKTKDDLPEFSEEEILEEWQNAPVSDPDEYLPDDPRQWSHITIDQLVGKKEVHIRLDWEIVNFFKDQAKKHKTKYQTDINQVLKGYVTAQKQKQLHHHQP